MLIRSISRTDAAPIPMPSARSRIFTARRSRSERDSRFESSTPAMARLSGGMTMAHATTGPASGPRPTSSTPAISGPCWLRRSRSIVLQRMGDWPRLLFRGPRSGHHHFGLLLLDTRRLAGELAEIEELRATDAAATDDRDVADHRAVHREDALDADAVGNLPDGECLADSSAAAGDANALERLNAFLVTFFDANVHAQRIAGTKCRHVRAHPALLSLDKGVHMCSGLGP